MPTSRYCDQSPSAISTRFTSAASAEPGTSERSDGPMTPATFSRTVAARAGSPPARSSITRSIIERAKVTPQALTA